ncbi:KamA family radical SAM protein [Candidatus Woesearchaeota archaeon]|nr:KamA family radical SAM protein [Candidatus Woesearchaeota archaeon]
MNMKTFLEKFPEEAENIQKVRKVYPMRVSNHFLNLIQEKDDPIWKQVIPDIAELEDNSNEEDPLHEEKYTPVPCLVHRYPDKVLLLVSNKCATYCRFCTRKRKVGKDVPITKEMITNAINYIADHKKIRDVIVSGGDPLMLTDEMLEFVLQSLRDIPHIEIIRIGTRIPSSMPSRVTPELAQMIAKYHPVYVNVHFNHPMEITEESKRACSLLANAGIPLGNQSVLLKGVNDKPAILKELFQKLVAMRVKPYYLYQADLVKGTEHFRTDVETGLRIMEKIQGHTSGLCMPQFAIDVVGGGKVPLLPANLQFQKGDLYVLRNFEGKLVEYRDPKRREYKKRALQRDHFKMGIVFNLKREIEKGMPEDQFAEYDDISVPLAMKSALEKKGIQTDVLETDENLYERLKSGQYDLIFNFSEGVSIGGGARESEVPAMLDALGIPYTGSGVLTHAIVLDKARTKDLLTLHRIPNARYHLLHSGNEKINPNMTFPMFVKPNREGSSKGIKNNALVNNERELRKIAKWVIKTYNQPALVEEYLDGREFTVSIIGNENPKVLPLVEVTFDYLPPHINKFDSYEVKWFWDNPSNPIDPVVCPAKVSKELQKQIEEVCLKTYKALSIHDFCRMDVRLDKDGVPHIIEVNAIPGLLPDPLDNSRFPKSCYALGMTYDDIIYSVVAESMKRHGMHEQAKKLENESSRIIQLGR